jgi:hypothetical protein
MDKEIKESIGDLIEYKVSKLYLEEVYGNG